MKAQILALMGILLLIVLPTFVSAFNFNNSVSTQDQTTFDQILEPVMTIYNLIKYFASALAGISLLATGVIYMTSGADPRKRDNAKSTAMYIVIGLLIIWAAPLVVNLLVG